MSNPFIILKTYIKELHASREGLIDLCEAALSALNDQEILEIGDKQMKVIDAREELHKLSRTIVRPEQQHEQAS